MTNNLQITCNQTNKLPVLWIRANWSSGQPLRAWICLDIESWRTMFPARPTASGWMLFVHVSVFSGCRLHIKTKSTYYCWRRRYINNVIYYIMITLKTKIEWIKLYIVHRSNAYIVTSPPLPFKKGNSYIPQIYWSIVNLELRTKNVVNIRSLTLGVGRFKITF